MKYGEYIQHNSIAEWSSMYIEYEKAKDIIYETEKNVVAGQVPISPFLDFLTEELDKVTAFYHQQIDKYVNELEWLSTQTASLPDATIPKRKIIQYKKQYLSLHKAFHYLRSFLTTNAVAFVKACKKFDKVLGTDLQSSWSNRMITESPNFNVGNDSLIHLYSKRIEHELIDKIYHGDHKRARARIYKEEIQEPKESSWSLLRAGFYFGASTCILLDAFIFYCIETSNEINRITLHQLSALFLLVLFVICLSVCYHIWKVHRINWSFIMEFDTRSILSGKAILDICGFLLFTWSIALYITVRIDSPHVVFVGLGLLCLWLLILVIPLHIFRPYTRSWLLRKLGRIFTPGLQSVKFADFLIADIMVSFAFLWITIWVIGCSVNKATREKETGINDIGSSSECRPTTSWISLPLLSYTFVIRALQSIRRYSDDRVGNYLQIINAGKYGVALVLVVISSAYNVLLVRWLWYLWIVIAIISTIYSTVWDIVVDWGIGSFYNGHKKRQYLFPKRTYYIACILNIILRCSWISLLTTSVLVTRIRWAFVLSVLEVLRRSMWIFFRVSAEQVNNIENYRAVRDIPVVIHQVTDDDDNEDGDD